MNTLTTELLAEYNTHILSILLTDPTFSMEESRLKQLIREVAIGVCLHEVEPSVHLQEGISGVSPLIPPAYRYTLVGELLTQLAYHVQGYLYGGIEDPLNPQQPLSFSRFFLHNHQDLKYDALPTLLERHKLTRKPGEFPTENDQHAVRFTSFKTSFNLTFKYLDSFVYDHVLHMSSDFDVAFEIEPPSEYRAFLQDYLKSHGTPPEDYQDLKRVYSLIANQMKTNLPLYIPQLIQTLHVIQKLVGYFKHVKSTHRIPELAPITENVFGANQTTLSHLLTPSHRVLMSTGLIYSELYKNKSITDAYISAICGETWPEVLTDALETCINDMFTQKNTADRVCDAMLNEEITYASVRVKNAILSIGQYNLKLRHACIATLNNNKLRPIDDLPMSVFDPQEMGKYIAQQYTDFFTEADEAYQTAPDEDVPAIVASIEAAKAWFTTSNTNIDRYRDAMKTNREKLRGNTDIAFCYETLVTVDKEYREAREKISFPSTHCALPSGRLTILKHQEPITISIVRALKDTPKESVVAVKHDEQYYLTFKLNVQKQWVLNNTAYMALANTIATKQPEHLFTETELEELLTFIQEKTPTITISPNKTNNDGQNMLHYAVLNQTKIQPLKTLLNLMPNGLQQQDKFGHVPLHSAASSGHVEAISLFLEHALINLNQPNHEGFTPLMMAAMQGQTTAVRTLLQANANPNLTLQNGQSALYLALRNNQTNAALCLIQEPKTDINQCTLQDETALHIALENQCDEVATHLIERDVDLTTYRQTDGYDALAVAAYVGASDKIINLILKTLAKRRDELVYIYAQAIQKLETLKPKDEELQRHSKARGWGNLLGTALSMMCWSSKAGFTSSFHMMSNMQHGLMPRSNQLYANSIQQLNDELQERIQKQKQPQSGVDYSSADDLLLQQLHSELNYLKRPLTHPILDGFTSVIHIAATHGNLDVVKALIEFETDNIAIKDRNNENALMRAIRAGVHNTAWYLSENTPINSLNKDQETASLMAIRRGQMDILDNLLQRGEDPSLGDKKGEHVIGYFIKTNDYPRFRQLKPEHLALFQPKHPMLANERGLLFEQDTPSIEELKAAIRVDDLDYLRQYLRAKTATTDLIEVAITAHSLYCVIELMPLMPSTNWAHLMELSIACRHLEIINVVLSYASDRNIALNSQGHTIAHLIVKVGLFEAIDNLSKHGVLFEVQAPNGDTPLSLAISRDDAKTLKQLIRLPNTEPKPGELLLLAIHHQSPLCEALLLTKYYETVPESVKDRVFLNVAHPENNLALMQKLFENAKISEATLATQLINALVAQTSSHQKIAWINLLLLFKANPTFKVQGKSALEVAVRLNQIDAINSFYRTECATALLPFVMLTKNPYTQDALEGRSERLESEIQKLLTAHMQQNATAVNALLAADLPFNNLQIGDDKAPFLHYLLRSPAKTPRDIAYVESVLDAFHTEFNPFLTNKDDETLATCLTLPNPKQRLAWIEKYFKTQKEALLKQDLPEKSSLLSYLSDNFSAELISLGFPLEDSRQQSLLFYAVHAENEHLIRALHAHHVGIDIEDRKMKTPLMVAAANGNLHLVTLLIETYLADPNKKDLEQCTALHHALLNRHANVALYLLQKTHHWHQTTRRGETPFMIAASRGLLSVCEALVGSVRDFEQCNRKGNNALHVAAMSGHIPVIKFLIKHGMSVNSPTGIRAKLGETLANTPLHYAYNAETALCLLLLGADLTQKNNRGATPLYILINNKTDLLGLLRQSAAFADNTIHEHMLLVAAGCGNLDLVRELVNLNQININCLDDRGQNALHYAVKNQQTKTAAFLIACGVFVDQYDYEGTTPLHIAAEHDVPQILRLLVGRWQINPNLPNKDGKTALYIAASKGHMASFINLLLLRPQLAIAANDGLTPAQIAFKNDHREIATLLFILEEFSIFEISFRRTLNPEQIDFLKQLIAYNKEIVDAGGHELHTAVLLQHKAAIRLMCDLSSNLREKANQHSLTPIMLAREKGYTDIENMLETYPGRDLTPLIALYKPLPFKTYYSYATEELITHLSLIGDGPLNIVTTEALAKILSGLKLSTQQAFLNKFMLLHTPKEQVLYRRYWHDFFKKLIEHDQDFLTSLDVAVLSRYPWDIIFATTKFQEIIQNLLEQKSKTLDAWFLSMVKPLAVITCTHELWQVLLTLFADFLHVFKANPEALKQLCLPPSTPISFHVCSDYMTRVNTVLTQCSDLAAQSSVLNQLPDAALIKEAFLNNYPFVSQAMVYESRLEIMPEAKLETIANQKRLRAVTLSSLPHQYHEMASFFASLDQIKTNEFTDAHRFILSMCLLNCVEKPITPKMATAFVQVALNIKLAFGDAVFRQVFKAHGLHKLPLNTYLVTAQNMLQLVAKKHIEPLQLIDELRRTTEDMPTYVTRMYQNMLRIKMNQENIHTLRERFLTLSAAVRYPIAASDLDSLIASYANVITFCETYACKSNEELLAEIQLLTQCVFSQTTEEKLLACLRLIMFQIRGLYPYDTQILTLMIMISKPQHCKGLIAQVRTGEGKTTLVAMLATYFAVQNLNVDIITSSDNLAEVAEREQQEFFSAAGVTSSTVTGNEPTPENFRGQIIYSTSHNLEFVILREKLNGKKIRFVNGKQRKSDVVIVDEADNLFLDSAYTTSRITMDPVFDTRWVYQTIYAFIKQAHAEAKTRLITVANVRTKLSAAQFGRHAAQLDLFPDSLLQTWIISAENALLHHEQNRDYVIEPKDHKDPTGDKKITTVNAKLTGRKSKHSRWSNGLHEFLEVKHSLEPELESLSAASIAHVAFFNEYTLIFGLTGTIGQDSERHELKVLYNVILVDIPPHLPFVRNDEPAQYFTDRLLYEAAIIARSKRMISANRASLTLCDTIEKSSNFLALYQQQSIPALCLNDDQTFNEDYILSQAGKPGAQTIATNVAGRGTDVLLKKPTLAAGGLDAILTSFAENIRVEDQAKGRAGRQGQVGSTQLIIYSEDPVVVELIPNPHTRLNLCSANSPAIQGNTSLSTDEMQRLAVQYLYQLRTKSNDALSANRIVHSTKEMNLYHFVKDYCDNVLQNLQTSLAAIPKATLISCCKEWETDETFHPISDFAYNRITKTAYLFLSVLLKAQNRQVTIDWNPVITAMQNVYMTYLKQKWAILYSRFDDEALEMLPMQAEYSLLLSQYIQPIINNPTKAMTSFLQQLLYLAHNFNPKPAPHTTAIPQTLVPPTKDQPMTADEIATHLSRDNPIPKSSSDIEEFLEYGHQSLIITKLAKILAVFSKPAQLYALDYLENNIEDSRRSGARHGLMALFTYLSHESETRLKAFESHIFSQYPWQPIIFNANSKINVLTTIIEKMRLNPSKTIEAWFLRYFEPFGENNVTVEEWVRALTEFDQFLTLLSHERYQPHIALLSQPPGGKSISFRKPCNYLTRVILILEHETTPQALIDLDKLKSTTSYKDEAKRLEIVSRRFLTEMRTHLKKSCKFFGSVSVETVDECDSDDESIIWEESEHAPIGARHLSRGFVSLSQELSFWSTLKKAEFTVKSDSSVQLDH